MASRVAVPHVLSAAEVLRARLRVAEAQGLAPDQIAAAQVVEGTLDAAVEAATGGGGRWPRSWWRRFWNWWYGALVEESYRHLHAARVQIIDVYDEVELAAEIPGAVARAQGGLHPDDPRRLSAASFRNKDVPRIRAELRRLIEDGYDSSDAQHQRLRSFRNIILLAAAVVTIVVVATLIIVARQPSLMPLCFLKPDDADAAKGLLSCPSAKTATVARANDVLIVALIGLIGGALAAVVSIRGLKGSSVPYDAPVALALLKLPLGALSAIVGILLVHGEFIPGLSRLDSQNQILAYALLFGAAQQVFTRLLDQKAQTLLEALPSKAADSDPGTPATATTTSDPTTVASAGDVSSAPPVEVNGGDGEVDALAATVLSEEEPEPELLDNPEGDEQDQVHDDDSEVMPDPPPRDHK